MRHAVLLIALAACDDVVFPGPEPPVADAEGWCGVRATFAASCTSCHVAGGAIGGLDLVTDPHAAVVNAQSSAYPGEVLVVPEDPEGSLLYRKMTGTQAPDEGGVMPPTGSLDEAVLALVRDWIEGGADDVCEDGGGGTAGGQGVHPEGWAFPDAHGLATKLQTFADCRTCHGDRLQGGDLAAGIACDDCHRADWETTCTFCHGGELDGTGAPPQDIDDAVTGISFPAHAVHVSETIHAAWDCVQCHTKPVDALTPGHLFDDDSPAQAEVAFGQGLSPAGTYDGNGGCSNLYCHGTGRQDGRASATETRDGKCDLCHADWTDDRVDLDTMSGQHEDHVKDGVPCAACHGDVVDASRQIVGPGLHVDGTVQVRLPAGMTRSGDTCTGTCHHDGDDEVHQGEDW